MRKTPGGKPGADEDKEVLPGWPESRVDALAVGLLSWLERFSEGNAELRIDPRPAGGWTVRLG